MMCGVIVRITSVVTRWVLKGTQEIADEGEIADPWDGGAGFSILFLEQPSQHNGFAISDIEHGFRRPIAELKLGDRGTELGA